MREYGKFRELPADGDGVPWEGGECPIAGRFQRLDLFLLGVAG